MKNPPIDKVILGHMPLIGVSYQSSEIDKKYREKFTNKIEIKKIIQKALNLGIIKIAASSPAMSPLAEKHLNVLNQLYTNGLNFSVIPCFSIPLKIKNNEINAFKRWATYIKVEEKNHQNVLTRVLKDPVLNFRPGWREKLPNAKPYDEKDLHSLTIDAPRVEREIEYFKDLPVSYIEPGSETDFIAMAGRNDLIGLLIDQLNDSGYDKVLFGVHHAGETISRLDDIQRIDGYVTPINMLGVMMLPNQKTAENAIRKTSKKIIAIKPLAGGRIKPHRAYHYVLSYNVEACMFGAATEEEVKTNHLEMLKALKAAQ